MQLTCNDLNKVRSTNLCVIDNHIVNDGGKSVALSKNDFAEYVLHQQKGFDNLDFAEFAHIFRIITRIIKSQKRQTPKLGTQPSS